jgi:hypothetical protein
MKSRDPWLNCSGEHLTDLKARISADYILQNENRIVRFVTISVADPGCLSRILFLPIPDPDFYPS